MAMAHSCSILQQTVRCIDQRSFCGHSLVAVSIASITPMQLSLLSSIITVVVASLPACLEHVNFGGLRTLIDVLFMGTSKLVKRLQQHGR